MQNSYQVRDKSLQWLWRRCHLKVLMDGRTTGQTDDGQKVITTAHPEHSSGELETPIMCSNHNIKKVINQVLFCT